MTWHSPHTFTDGDVPDDTLFNEQIRDNFLVLKVCRDNNGRLSGINASTFADLTPIAGIALVAVANAFTAGVTRFLGNSRLVLPVGTDLFADLGGGNRAGMWVDGTDLHYMCSDQVTERKLTGTLLAVPAGPTPRAGSLWVESAYLKYIDATGRVRRLGGTLLTTVAAAIPGSLWIQTTTVRYIDPSHRSRTLTGTVVPSHAAIWTHLFGVSAAGGTLTKTAIGGGWTDAGAVTQQVLTGNGYIEYTLTGPAVSQQAMIGLAHIDGSHRYPDNPAIAGGNLYAEMNHAVNVLKPSISFAGTMLAFYSSGVYGGEVFDTTPAYGDVIRVNKAGTVITVLKNGVLIGTSGVASAATPLVGYAALHDDDMTVENVVLGGAWS